MRKRVFSFILSLLLCISCFSSTVMAAEIDIEKSSLTSAAFSCSSGDLLDIVFYINASNSVQGFNGTIKLKTGLKYYTSTSSPIYEVNSELKNVTTYANSVGNLLYNFSLLFNPNGGQTFTKKTELIRFHTQASNALTNQTLVYTVEELFDKDYTDVAASKITCAVEKVTATQKTLSSITVSPPTKTSYYQNDSFLKDGMKVTAVYSDGSTEDVTNTATVSSPDMSTAGTKPVTVTYGGKTASFNITVTAIAITKIVVTKNPTKTSYYTNETFSSAGTEVTVYYNNDTTKVITSGMTFSSPDMTTAGTKPVTVTYGGKTATFDITVTAVTVISLSVSKNPTKTSYFTGDTFDSSGLKVTAKYNNDTSGDVTSSVTLSSPDMSTPGTKPVTVTYAGQSTSFSITVTQLEVTGLTIINYPSKVSYYTGDTFSISGIKVRAVYNNSTTADVTSSLTYTAPNMNTSGTKKVTVSYGGKSTSFDITVTDPVVTGITVTTKPTKLTYFTGETFSSAGLKVTATYENNTTKDVTSSVTLSTPNMNTAETKTITVTYAGKTATFTITVKDPTVTGISVTSTPTKLSYYTGDTFVSDGMKITAAYENNTTKDVTSSVTLSTPDMNTAGTKDITVTYAGKTATFRITVTQTAVSYLTVSSKPNKSAYFTGDTFSSDGLKITAFYNNSTTKDVTALVTLSNPDMSTPGTKQIVVSYDGKNVTFDITVTQTAVTSIEINPPSKLSYFTGEILNTAGMTVTAYYNNGTSKDVTNDVSVSEPDMSTAGTKPVAVTFENNTASFNITVTEVTATGLNLSKTPEKLEYYVGEVLNTNGIEVYAAFNNGETRDVSDSLVYSYPDMNTEGTKSVTASFGGQSVSFDITVKAVTAVSLSINKNPDKTNYYVGETFEPNGIEVTALFSNSETRDVTDSLTFSQPDMTTPGEKPVTVTFGGQSIQFNIVVTEIVPTALSIIKLPDKVDYYIGESFTAGGINIKASFNDGTSKDVTDSVSYSAPDMTSEGIKEITVSYGGVTASFVINVISATVTEITVTKLPDKVDYYTGETLDTLGMVITATYSDGASKDITQEAVYSQPDMSTAGTKTVEIIFAGQRTEFNINVTEAAATGISITQYPSKVTYFIGETFDPSGIIVMAAFSDGSTRDVTNSVSYTQPDMTAAGEKEITVTFGNVSSSFNITALDIEVTAIAITQFPDKLEYNAGDEFTYSGIAVTADFSDGTSSDVTGSITVAQPDMLTPGVKAVIVSYGGKTAEYNITVIENAIQTVSISVANEPAKTYYNVGDVFSSEGLIVTAIFSDGSTKDVTDSVTISEPDMNTTGTYDVLLSYDGSSTSYKIYVTAAELISITVEQPPEKTEYYLGENFISDGMKVTAAFSDGSTLDVTDSVTYSQPDMLAAGVKQITVSFADKSTEISITVLEISLTGITISSYPEKLSYTTGDIFAADGLTVTASYSDGSTRDVTENVVISYPDMTSAGTKQVTITYGEQTAVFEINVADVVLSAVTVTSYPTKTEYGIGEKLDTTGLVVTAQYDNGTTRDITSETVITEPDMSTLGNKTVSIEYNGFTASFEITVSEITITSIVIQNSVNRSAYYTDEPISYEGLLVSKVYNNGNTEDITSEITITEPDMTTPGDKQVVIEYQGYQTVFGITVYDRTLENVEYVLPTKTEYVIGEQLDISNLSAAAIYNGDFRKDVTDQVQVTGFDSTTPGTKTVVIDFQGFQTSFTVEVIAAEALSLEVTPPTKTEYEIGDILDTTGMIVYADYGNNVKVDVTNQVEIQGFDSSKAGMINVTAVYAALSAEFTVTVKEKETQKEVITGDSNGDGRITTKDSLNALRYAIGLWKNVSAEIKAALDVDGNGKVTASDALKIQRYAIGLVKTLG